MTTFAGNLWPSAIHYEGAVNPAFGQLEEPDATLGWPHTALAGGAALTEHQPVAESPVTVAGTLLPMYGFLDFYNRIHFSVLTISLGAVVSEQSRELLVFNAYFVPRVLLDIDSDAADGIDLAQPGSLPLAFRPLQELSFEFSVSPDGPPLVDATYTFTFDNETVVVTLEGIRIVAWVIEPNWLEPVVERLIFKTDVQPNYDGSERRLALKGAPVTEWEFTFDTDDAARRALENLLHGWGGNTWSLPIWPDLRTLEADLTPGATVIALDTAGLDYHATGAGVLIGEAGVFESFEVESVAADELVLARPLARAWAIGTRVYPARSARLLEPRGGNRLARNYLRGSAIFRTTEEIERAVAAEATYRSVPLLEVEPNWRESPQVDYTRLLAEFDPGTGSAYVEDEAGIAIPTNRYQWTMLTREEADDFRAFAYNRNGRQKGIWVPTWINDLVLAEAVDGGDSALTVEPTGLAQFAPADPNRRDLRIELVDGAVLYRRVGAVSVNDDETESLQINAPLGLDVDPEDVARISFMTFMRLEADVIEIGWQTPAIAEAQISMRARAMTFEAREVSTEDADPIELFRFTVYGELQLYTSAADDVEHDSQTYLARGPISHGPFQTSAELKRNNLDLKVAPTFPITEFFNGTPPSSQIALQVIRKHRGDLDGKEWWNGRVLNCSWGRGFAVLHCETIYTSMQRFGLRRLYSKGCPHVLYGDACGISEATFAISAVLGGVAGAVLQIPAAAAYEDGRFAGGKIRWEASPGIFVVRGITAHEGQNVQVTHPIEDLAGGVTLALAPGCKHNKADCKATFNNVENYGGFPYATDKNPFGSSSVF